jgi:choline monooxygenase
MPGSIFATAELADDFHLAIDRPTAEARGLPNEAYTSAAYLAFERDQLFAKTWSVVGLACDIPRAGDVKPVSLLGIPLVMLRDRSGGLRVFHNVCSHRGLELVAEPCRVSGALRCPYHSWTYDLTGKLIATPGIGGAGQNSCPGLEKARHGLKTVRSAVWLDMVFVNLSGDAPDFAEHMAPLNQRWAAYDFSLLRHGGSSSSWSIDLKTNWKLGVENHCDAYHLPWIHPDLNRISRLEDHYDIKGEGPYAGQGSRAYLASRPEGAPALPRFPGLSDSQARQAEYVSLFPNATAGVHGDHVWIVWFEPLAPDRTRERMEIYYIGEEPLADAFAETRRKICADWFQVFDEDRGVVEGMQRGRASPAFQGGVFSGAVDQPTHAFHVWVARALARANTNLR